MDQLVVVVRVVEIFTHLELLLGIVRLFIFESFLVFEFEEFPLLFESVIFLIPHIDNLFKAAVERLSQVLEVREAGSEAVVRVSEYIEFCDVLSQNFSGLNPIEVDLIKQIFSR